MLSSSMSPQLRPLFSKNRFLGQISSWFDYVMHRLSFSDSRDGVEPSASSDHRWKVQPSLSLAQAHAPTFWRGQFFARSDDHFHLTRNAFNPRVSPFPYYIIGFICKPINILSTLFNLDSRFCLPGISLRMQGLLSEWWILFRTCFSYQIPFLFKTEGSLLEGKNEKQRVAVGV